MKRALLSLGLGATDLLSAIVPKVLGRQPVSLGGYHVAIPLHSTDLARLRKTIAATTSSTTVPRWNYTITSPLDCASVTFGARVCQ